MRQRICRNGLLLVVTTGLLACTSGPEFPERTAATNAPAPTLLPISAVLRQTADGPNSALLTDTSADARARALRARADRLRGPVIPNAESEGMRAAGTALR
ncbi:hypothetical protein [Roseinatronobacter sp.]|uniref:hypothetical protein n=1 Tax=Roseinatronobacter sp. TaxID=1945755 RepID=UPI003F6E59A5